MCSLRFFSLRAPSCFGGLGVGFPFDEVPNQGLRLTPSSALQLAEEGTLRQYIKARQSTIEDHDRMRFVRELAAGMSFLHLREVLLHAPSALNPAR